MRDMMKDGLRAGAATLVATVAVMAFAGPAAADKSDKIACLQLIPLDTENYPQVQTDALNLLAVGQPRARRVGDAVAVLPPLTPV